MEYIYIGLITNTHGLKGEIRILSDFRYKELIFIKGFKIYIGDTKEKCVIESYRKHKNYDMIIFSAVNNINQVLKYKGKRVYVNKDDLKLVDNMILDEEVIGCNVYENNEYIGVVTDIMKLSVNDIMVVINEEKKKILIPYINEFIKEVDIDKKRISIKSIEGLISS